MSTDPTAPRPASVEVWAIPGKHSIIDEIIESTGLTRYYQHTPAEVLAREPLAVRMTWADWTAAAIARQQTPIVWQLTDEATYYEMLEVLPPAMMAGGAFLVGEPMDHDVATGAPRFSAFRQRGNTYETASRPLTCAELRAELAPRFASAADAGKESAS